MIAVLAHRHDLGARAWVRRHAPRARLVTSEDLARPGWRLSVGAASHEADDAGEAVLDGEIVDARAIALVVTVMSRVSAHELFGFHPEDRAYAAAEMTAFLVAWLAALPCAVVNRPTPDSLSGPMHTQESWLLLARAHGIPVIELRRATSHATGPLGGGARPLHTVSVIGEQCTGAASEPVRRHALELARAAQVEMLTASFDVGAGAPRLASVRTLVDLARPEVAAALDDYLGQRGRA